MIFKCTILAYCKRYAYLDVWITYFTARDWWTDTHPTNDKIYSIMRLLAAVLSLKMFLTQPMLIKDAMLIWMSGLHILPETERYSIIRLPPALHNLKMLLTNPCLSKRLCLFWCLDYISSQRLMKRHTPQLMELLFVGQRGVNRNDDRLSLMFYLHRMLHIYYKCTSGLRSVPV